MPSLKRLNILGNIFTENGKLLINELRKKQIKVNYSTDADRQNGIEKNNSKENK